MAISCGGPPHQSSGPFLGRVLLDASNSTTQLIKYSVGIKGKSSRSDARGCDLSTAIRHDILDFCVRELVTLGAGGVEMKMAIIVLVNHEWDHNETAYFSRMFPLQAGRHSDHSLNQHL